MKQVVLIIVVLFLYVVVLLLKMQPEEITLKDFQKGVAPQKSTKELSLQETNLVDSSKTNGNDQIQDNYYIIVGSFKILRQAQQKAEKLTNDFSANIIMLPPTKEGNYRISYGKYSTPEEAQAIIKSIRTDISPDAWVFSEKK
jgi:hypothetical protein